MSEVLWKSAHAHTNTTTLSQKFPFFIGILISCTGDIKGYGSYTHTHTHTVHESIKMAALGGRVNGFIRHANQ